MRLRTVREARGWTLPDLAIATGLSASYLSRVERSERSLSPEARIRIARALRLSVTEAGEVDEIGTVPDSAPTGVVTVEEVAQALAHIGIDLYAGAGAS